MEIDWYKKNRDLNTFFMYSKLFTNKNNVTIGFVAIFTKRINIKVDFDKNFNFFSLTNSSIEL